MVSPVLVWLRRDLRLDDSHAIAAALETGAPIAFVYVLDPQTRQVRHRQLTLGTVDAAGVAVTSGLQPGEQVVTTGVDRLRDGQVVELAGQGPR